MNIEVCKKCGADDMTCSAVFFGETKPPMDCPLVAPMCSRTGTTCAENFENNIDCPSDSPEGCQYLSK